MTSWVCPARNPRWPLISCLQGTGLTDKMQDVWVGHAHIKTLPAVFPETQTSASFPPTNSGNPSKENFPVSLLITWHLSFCVALGKERGRLPQLPTPLTIPAHEGKVACLLAAIGATTVLPTLPHSFLNFLEIYAPPLPHWQEHLD